MATNRSLFLVIRSDITVKQLLLSTIGAQTIGAEALQRDYECDISSDMAREIFRRLVETSRGWIHEQALATDPNRAHLPEEILEESLGRVGYYRGRGVFRNDVFMNGWTHVPFRDALTDFTYDAISGRIDSHRNILEPVFLEDDARGIKAVIYAFCFEPEFANISDVSAREMLASDMHLPVPFGGKPKLDLGDEHIERTIDAMMEAGYLGVRTTRNRNRLYLASKADQILA